MHKKIEIEFELLIDLDMLPKIGKGIQGRVCHAIHQYAKTCNQPGMQTIQMVDNVSKIICTVDSFKWEKHQRSMKVL